MAIGFTEIKLPRTSKASLEGQSVATAISAGVASRPPTLVEVLAPNLMRTSRMMLRPLRASDRAEYLRVLNLSREHLGSWMNLHRDGETDHDLFERQLTMCQVGDSRGAAWRRVGMMEDGRLAGFFNLNSITRGLTFEADANWWVAADVKGVGLGSEGALAMVDHALLESPSGLGLHRVQAAIASLNVPSVRLAQRLGMKRVEAAQVNVKIGGSWERHDLWERGV